MALTLKTVKNEKTNGKGKSNGFSVTVRTEVEGFKVGTAIDRDALIMDYLQSAAATFDLDGETVDSLARVWDVAKTPEGRARCMAVVKAVDLKGVDAKDETVAFLSALANAPFATVQETEHVPSAVEQAAISAPEHDLAVEIAKEIPAEVLAQLQTSYDGKKAFDEGPVMTFFLFRDRFKDTTVGNASWIETLPPIGSRYQKGKNDLAPFGHRLPSEEKTDDKTKAAMPVWYGPFEHYLDKEGKAQSFVRDLYLNTKEGAKKLHELDCARNLAKENPSMAEDCPKEIRNLFELKKKAGMKELVREKEKEINLRIGILRKALYLWQRIDLWQKHFDGKFRVRLTGENLNESRQTIARKNLPIQICTIKQTADGPEVEAFATVPLSWFLDKDRDPRRWPTNVTAAKIIEKKTRTPKVEGDNQPGGGKSENTITNIAAFQEATVNMGLWVGAGEGNHELSRSRYTQLSTEAMKDHSFAAALVRLETVLDGAITKPVRDAAAQWERDQQEANQTENKQDAA